MAIPAKTRILTIAGSDSGGGAGIQIDIKTALAIGCDSSTVITALTAQNSVAVRAVSQVSLDMVEGQFRAVMDDFQIDAVKIGMVGDAQTARLIARLLDEYRPKNVVIDPVLAATSGGKLGAEGTVGAMLEYLVPRATLLTPNQDEAEVLCGLNKGEIHSAERADYVWDYLSGRGLNALLLKGGHAADWQGRETIIDKLYYDGGGVDITAKRIDIPEKFTHGTGCTLSSAIASYLALGYDLEEASHRGVAFVQQKLQRVKELYGV